MRLPASEKAELIHLVEQSHLPVRRTLEMLGIRPSTFYRWYDRFRSGGPEGPGQSLRSKTAQIVQKHLKTDILQC
jgi:transposase-like protein